MWLTDTTLNVGTSIIASVGMGVGIDYAIHYYSRFRLAFQECEDYPAAAIIALERTCRPIMFNALAVGTGFIALMFSEYDIIHDVGWITSLSMFTTAFASLMLLPVLICIFKPGVAR